MKRTVFLALLALFAFSHQPAFAQEGSLSAELSDTSEIGPSAITATVTFTARAAEQGTPVPTLLAQAPDESQKGGFWAYLRENWAALLALALLVAEAIVRLTPSDRDNSILNFLKSFIDKLIPNARQGGGSH